MAGFSFKSDERRGSGHHFIGRKFDAARKEPLHRVSKPAIRRVNLVFTTRADNDRNSLVVHRFLPQLIRSSGFPNRVYRRPIGFFQRSSSFHFARCSAWPHANFADILRLYSDKSFRHTVVAHCANEQVRSFWRQEYPKFTYRYQAEAIAPIQNKVGAFLADPRLYRFFIEPTVPLRLGQIMDESKVLIVNLAKGQIGSDSAALAGGLFVTTLSLASFSRASVSAETRWPFYIYVDEFQSFTTLSVASMAAELRKYRVGMILAHQYLQQLHPGVRHAVLGNAGTLISIPARGRRHGIPRPASLNRTSLPRISFVSELSNLLAPHD